MEITVAKNSFRQKVIKFVTSSYTPGVEINSSIVAKDMRADSGRVSTILSEMAEVGMLRVARKRQAGKRYRYTYALKQESRQALLRTYSSSELIQELMRRESAYIASCQ
jgi:DNA-binding PadR family transcriptional regulator